MAQPALSGTQRSLPTIAADGWFGSGKKREDDERIMPVLVNVSSQAIEVHFIHMKPAKGTYKVIVPLLLVHGWPSNVFEFYKIIPMLVDPVQQLGSDVDLAFEVVAPSIPGFAWSSAPKKTGFNTEATARIFWKLMTRLGFSRFLLQGGDWGSPITTSIALYFPQHVIGLHLNMATAISWKALLYQLVGLVLPKLAFSSETFHHFSPSTYFMDVLQETGYLHIQATKPDTVGMFLGYLNALRPQLIPVSVTQKSLTDYEKYTEDGFISASRFYSPD
ncbi:unnamed protein product [Gongylonema pulchrum]|uniref:AB hydrolase-1 domain-containing protein n=1 Tax=Gongylonema pulchrum TaxID=637853 RepID=A0A183DXY0_9BILA|nr:unnamed protein product [Gongylonema pulchrum]